MSNQNFFNDLDESDDGFEEPRSVENFFLRQWSNKLEHLSLEGISKGLTSNQSGAPVWLL